MDGVVYLVGAGPGDPGLLTRRGLECIKRAEVLVYDGLVSMELVAMAPAECLAIYAGKKQSLHGSPLSQDAITALLIEHASAGKVVVRLKGGDPFVFGRGAEECLALARACLRFEVVPGVSASTAVGAYAGIPLTARGISNSAVLVTGHQASDGTAIGVDWEKVAGNHTVVLFMAWKKIASCVAELLAAGRSPETPAAVIYRGTSASQKTLISTLERLPRDIAKEKLVPPLLVILGDVVLLRKELAWFESRPLFGLRVLMTRSPSGAGQYASELRDLGAEIAFAECTEVVAATADEVKGVETAVRELQRYDWLFFTSANAVRYFFAVLDGLQMDSRDCAGLRIAAVGQATAGALSARGLRADLLASGKSGAELAQLLCNKVKNEAKNARILFPRSAVGRKEPVEILEAAGLRCELVTPYNSRSIDEISPLLRDSLAKLKGGQIGAALFFSPSQVHALVQIDPSLKSHLAAIPIVAAIGKTTAAALEAHGIEVQVVPTKLSGKSLAEQIACAFSSRSG